MLHFLFDVEKNNENLSDCSSKKAKFEEIQKLLLEKYLWRSSILEKWSFGPTDPQLQKKLATIFNEFLVTN